MANKYEKINAATQILFDEALEKYHGGTSAVGVTFDLLFGYAPVNDEGERTGPALKISGYPTNSISKIVDLANRVKGNGDAQIILDGDTWADLKDEQKIAILDRAINQFDIARNLDGEVVTDTHGRPKLKMVKADWQFSYYSNIAKRHGKNSPEMESIKQFSEVFKQTIFGFTEDVKELKNLEIVKEKSAPKKKADTKK